MLKSYSYKAAAHWTNHKRGIVDGDAIPRTINFAAPPEFGGEPGLWTPEHLLLAAVSTCDLSSRHTSKMRYHPARPKERNSKI